MNSKIRIILITIIYMKGKKSVIKINKINKMKINRFKKWVNRNLFKLKIYNKQATCIKNIWINLIINKKLEVLILINSFKVMIKIMEEVNN